jgi:nucleoside-diphosphate-sugar epimerase
MTPDGRELHVVFGAGQIGPQLARVLAARGHTVRLVRRSAGRPDPGIPVVTGDAGDPAFAAEATRGATAIYHCMNPAYDVRVWERELPRLMQSLIAAAGRQGARLVVLDNLYMLGHPGGVPMNEDTPMKPTSKKGAVRARVAEMLLDAHRRGVVRATSGRASDFYGPRADQSYFGKLFWPDALRGKTVRMPLNLDEPHTWHYTGDVAEAVARLGCSSDDDVYGRWWMLPAAPAVTAREMASRLAGALGKPIRVARVPAALLKLLGLFVPILREVNEMAYQWETPFLVDDRRFRERFGMTPTPLDAGAPATVEWARKAFGVPA